MNISDTFAEADGIPGGTKIKKVVVCKGITAIGHNFMIGQEVYVKKLFCRIRCALLRKAVFHILKR